MIFCFVRLRKRKIDNVNFLYNRFFWISGSVIAPHSREFRVISFKLIIVVNSCGIGRIILRDRYIIPMKKSRFFSSAFEHRCSRDLGKASRSTETSAV